MFDEAQTFWGQGRYEESIQLFIALTKAFPSHELVDDSMFWIANIYEHYLMEPTQAIRYYRSLNNSFEESEYYLDSMQSLVRIYSSQGDEGKRTAALILQKLLLSFDNEDEVNYRLKLSKIWLDLKSYEPARSELKKILLKNQSESNIINAYYLIGLSYLYEGKLKLAEFTFYEVAKKFNFSKNVSQAILSLAGVKEELGKLNEAIVLYENLQKKYGDTEFLNEALRERIYRTKARLKKTRG